MKIIYVLLTFSLVSTTTVKVISTAYPGDTGPEPCVLQCYGSSGINTAWVGLAGNMIYTSVETKGCGFKAGSNPHITATVNGDGMQFLVGSPNVQRVKGATVFLAILKSPDKWAVFNNLDYARAKKWRIDWVATGFSC